MDFSAFQMEISSLKRPQGETSAVSIHIEKKTRENALLTNIFLKKTDDNSQEAVNAIIRQLSTPNDQQSTNVSKMYANDIAQGNEVKAYAKIAGHNWTYFVKELKVTIGRNAESFKLGDEGGAEIDLGPSKVVSRNHAVIEYNLQRRCWELFISGRNGLKVNGYRLNFTPNTPYELNSGNIIDIGGTQMMFILPDSPPIIPDFFRGLLQNKKPKTEPVQNAQQLQQVNDKDIVLTDQVRAFQLREGVSLPDDQSNSSERDLSKDECKGVKPPFSYATMITQAILSNQQGILSLSEIYDWIASHYAYYRHTKQGWQNSIRHNLSLNKAFEKVPRKPNEPGKGMKWQISESYRKDFMNKWRDGSLSKMKRGTSVSRQLQIHLIKNNALPQGRQFDLVNVQTPSQFSTQPNRTAQFISTSNEKQTPQILTLQESQQHIPSRQHTSHTPQIQDQKFGSPLKTLNSLANDNNGHSRTNSYNNGTDPGESPIKTTASSGQQLQQHAPPPVSSFQSPIKKQLMNLPELMTPERGLRQLDPPIGLQGSTNSSPALWNYVQFSTPLGTDKKNGSLEPQSIEKGNISNGLRGPSVNGNSGESGEIMDIQKVDLDSPLKNRKVIKVDDELKKLKDV